MSDGLMKAFPRATFIPFNPRFPDRLADAMTGDAVDTIIVDSTLPDYSISRPDNLLREHWLVSNTVLPVLEIGCQKGDVFRNQGFQQWEQWNGFDIDV